MFWGAFFLICFGLAAWLLGSSLVGRLLYPLHYREHIFESAERYGVDPFLVAAVIHTESSFQSDAISSKGALGLMQIMPPTASWAAEKIGYTGFSPELLFQPAHNIEIGTWCLQDLFQQFGESEAIVLAAYNAGRGEVARWLEEEIWDGAESNLEQIPFSETRYFTRRALEAYRRYRKIYHCRTILQELRDPSGYALRMTLPGHF